MARLSVDEEDAAVARVKAAREQHDVAAITAELAASLGSSLVVACCCLTFVVDSIAPAAAASADVLLLVLEAVRRHADYDGVTSSACALVAKLLRLNAGLVVPAVKGGALELALATVRSPQSGLNAVTAALYIFVQVLLSTEHAVRAVQLGVVEVRCRANDVSTL